MNEDPSPAPDAASRGTSGLEPSALEPSAPEAAPDDRPISVRLGTVVPPEDPEDWRRPLTWVAAAGMLLGPLVALTWFLAAPPDDSLHSLPGTWLVAGALVIGAVTTGSTQLRPGWAFAATLGSGLFGALLTVIFGLVLAQPTTTDAAAPSMVHAVLASVAGLAGALAAATLMFVLGRTSRPWRGLLPGGIGLAIAALVVQLVFTA